MSERYSQAFMARDMAGDGILARDWVFDGERVWEVMAIISTNELSCRDPYVMQRDAVDTHVDASRVAKVRADRADDPAYLRAVYAQAETLRDFWADG